MADQCNTYIRTHAERALDDQDREAYATQGEAGVSNDILRSMLASRTAEGTEDDRPDQLPDGVFDVLASHSLLLDAYQDQIRDRTNDHAPAVEASMLALAALDMDRNALLVSTTFSAAEELVEETPDGWQAAQRFASTEQKEELGDLTAKHAGLEKMLNGAAGFIREAVRVPEGPELFVAGGRVSEGVEDARPVLRKHIELASTYGPDSTAEELSAALNNPNVTGTESYHVERMIRAQVAHDVLVTVMEKAGISFTDYPYLSVVHFAEKEGSDETAIVPLLRQMQVGDSKDHYHTKIVDLNAFDDTDKFMAQLQIVRSYNALVDFQEARRRVDPPDGDTPTQLPSESDIAALTAKPREAQAAYDKAIEHGLGEWLTSDQGASDVVTLVLTHGQFTEDAEIQGDMTHQMVFGAAPGEESATALMAAAVAAAEKALDADADVRAKAEALGMKLPGIPATDRLKAWFEACKSLDSSWDKIGAVWEEGLGGARGYDAVQASISVAKAAAGVIKETAAAAGDAYEEHGLRLKSHLDTPHAHDWVKKGTAVEMPDPSTPEIDGFMARSQAFKTLASAADGVALIGDVIGLADGFKKIAEGEHMAGGLDVVGGAIGIVGTVAARRVAAQGLASGAAFNLAQAAGPASLLFTYFQLIHSAFAKVEAAEKAFVAKRGVELFGGVTRQTKRGGEAALKAGAILRMSEQDRDPLRSEGFARELKRETKVASDVVLDSHDALLTFLTHEEPNSFASGVYQEWAEWPEQREAFHQDYKTATKDAPDDLLEGETWGEFETFKSGSTSVFTGMKDLAGSLETFVKEQAE